MRIAINGTGAVGGYFERDGCRRGILRTGRVPSGDTSEVDSPESGAMSTPLREVITSTRYSRTVCSDRVERFVEWCERTVGMDAEPPEAIRTDLRRKAAFLRAHAGMTVTVRLPLGGVREDPGRDGAVPMFAVYYREHHRFEAVALGREEQDFLERTAELAAGDCSPHEAVDWIVVGDAERYTVAQWADIGGATEDAVRSNVNPARERLLAEEDRDPTGGKEYDCVTRRPERDGQRRLGRSCPPLVDRHVDVRWSRL
jgi:hypothetical protein